MKEQIRKIVDYDWDFNEAFAEKCLDKAVTMATAAQERIYLLYDYGCIYFETESELTSSDFITFVEPN